MNLPIPLPALIAAGAGVFIIMLVTIIFVPRLLRKEYVDFFEIKRRRIIERKRGENFSGLVVYPDGGFVDREFANLDMIYGRAFLEKGPNAHRRHRKPVYITRVGDSAPIYFTEKGMIIEQIENYIEFDNREDMAAELAVANAAKKANTGDFLAKLMAVAIVILGIGLASMAVALAMKGLRV